MGKVVTAAELERMSPAERQAHFDASVVTDLSQVPAGYLEVIRTRLIERIAEQESAAPKTDQGSAPGASKAS